MGKVSLAMFFAIAAAGSTASACRRVDICSNTPQSTHRFFLENDRDRDGKLSFNEFRSSDVKVFEQTKQNIDEELIKDHFEKYDLNKDGVITEEEFNSVVLAGIQCANSTR